MGYLKLNERMVDSELSRENIKIHCWNSDV